MTVVGIPGTGLLHLLQVTNIVAIVRLFQTLISVHGIQLFLKQIIKQKKSWKRRVLHLKYANKIADMQN